MQLFGETGFCNLIYLSSIMKLFGKIGSITRQIINSMSLLAKHLEDVT